MSNNCYLYSITNKVNGKLYIGVTSNPEKRFAFHARQNINDKMAIRRAIGKHGKENFEMTVLVNASRDYCAELEKRAIIAYESMVPHGYNISKGGEGRSMPCTEERKQKLREAFKGRLLTDAHKINISNGLKGKILSEETKWKLSLSLKGRHISEEHRETNRKALTGIKRSEETKAKLRAAKLGKKHDIEVRQRQSDRLKAMWQNPEFKEKMLAARKKKGEQS